MPTNCPPELGGDADGDGVCGDADNCPDDFNPDQRNLDAPLDGLGDVCDDMDAVLDIRRASIRESEGQRGRVIVRGDVLLTLPDDFFDAGNGVAFRVTDSSNLDLSFTWMPDECTALQSGRVICRSGDKRFQARFQPLSERTGRLSFAITLKQLDQMSGPFAPMVMVVLTDDPPVPTTGIDRIGIIVDCRTTKNGLVCRTR